MNLNMFYDASHRDTQEQMCYLESHTTTSVCEDGARNPGKVYINILLLQRKAHPNESSPRMFG